MNEGLGIIYVNIDDAGTEHTTEVNLFPPDGIVYRDKATEAFLVCMARAGFAFDIDSILEDVEQAFQNRRIEYGEYFE